MAAGRWCTAIMALAFAESLAGATVVNTFVDPTYITELRHLVIHQRTGYLYVGAVNRIYELDSELYPVHGAIKTGPKLDNPNCEPREGDHCYCLAREDCNKKLTDSISQALALDLENNMLYACTNLFYGSCSRIRLSDFREEQYEYKPLVSNDPSTMNSSAVIVIAPGLNTDKQSLYIATTKSAIGFPEFTDLLPLIASRDLNTFDLTRIGYQTRTAISPRHRFKDIFKVYYHFGYSYKGFTYFIAIQKSEAADPGQMVSYETRIMRVCQKDQSFYSYVEVPLKCQPNFKKHFRILQTAYIGHPGKQVADALDLDENEEALFAVFTSSYEYSHIPKSPSAICVYSLKQIAQTIKSNQQYCFQGHGSTGPVHITTPVPCVSTNFKDYECGEHEANHPIEGRYQTVSTVVSHALSPNILATSLVAKAVGEHTILYIGDASGNLAKFVLYYYKESRQTYASMFAKISIDPSQPIRKDMVFNKEYTHLYVMTERQLYRVLLANCVKYTTCDECIGAGDPHCGWCASQSRCTEVDECSEVEYVWIKHNEKCPGIQKIQPHSLPYLDTDLTPIKVRLWLLTLPDPDKDVMCQIYGASGQRFDGRAFRNDIELTVTCEGFTGLPTVPPDEVAHNVSLTLVVADKQWVTTSVHIYDCSHFDSCSACTGSQYPCGWCIVDGLCREQKQSCPSKGPILVSPYVDVIHSRLVLSSGQSHVREGPDSCPSIEPIDDYNVPSGHEAAITVRGKNLQLWDGGQTYPGLSCVFKSPTNHIYTPAVVTEGAVGTEEYLIKCDPVQLSYIQDKGLINFPFNVEWEFGKVLENPQNVEVVVYKCSAMVSNCGMCLTLNAVYKCGWCQTVCTLEEDCPNWLNRDDVCPDPMILRFEPSSGPINGRTILTIHGFNLGRKVDDVRHGIKVAGEPCRVFDEGYVPSIRVQCETSPAGKITSGPVSVSVVDMYYTKTSTDYYYTEPQFDGLVPDKGLMSGDNVVALLGTDLNLGNNATVYVNSIKCPVQWTPAVPNPMSAPVRVEVDGEGYALGPSLKFYYLPNPDILNLHPAAAIVSGGTSITVRGTDFGGVQRAAIRINWLQAQVIIECSIMNSTLLRCILPDVRDRITEIPEDVGLGLPYDVQLDRLILTPRQLQETMEYRRIKLYGDPIVLPLGNLPDHVIAYEPDVMIKIKGENLAVLKHFPEWIVYVGRTPCPSYSVSASNATIEIYPPGQPDDVTDGLAEIEVRLGYYSSHPGSVQYPVNGESKVALILGLIFGLVLPIIVVMLVILICLRRQASKNHHTNRLALLTDNRGSYQPAAMLPPPSEMMADVHHDDTEDKNLIAESSASPEMDVEADGTDSPDYVQRLLRKIENKKLRQAVAEVVIPKDHIEIGEIIGHGHFGCVYVASLRDDCNGIATKVAVKTLQGDDFPPHLVTSFLEEGVVMKKFDHPHVLRLLGVGVGDKDEPMVIIPYMSNGDLRSYVRNKEKSFTARQLLQLAQQVAKGMAYLASLNFVHRDLAARNCMIDETNTVKVADFGLSKNLYEKDYYSSTRDRKTKLPVKWMALESLEEFRFTIKSDVWSFGVLMWELMTRGTTPYPDVDVFDLRTFLAEGRRLPKPKYCPEHVYTIMTDCWSRYPENRPTFADLVNRLELLLNPPKKRQSDSHEPMYVNFNEFDHAEYLNPISAPPPDTPAPDIPSGTPPVQPPPRQPELPPARNEGPPTKMAPPPPTREAPQLASVQLKPEPGTSTGTVKDSIA
ncbi:hypothetical protein LSH36_322g03037 [Paralvinella palmiformis]|uniref:Hepatocyte growth factor receptor n=1 Tax=Paralvinella palmiformis TaxID=53620 RepID=A0AAD9N392_9ANNE|nr:hypothetical protein LSH36_322g03037 [Paralvinella palmiformis]